MIFAKLKAYLMAALALFGAVITALFYRSKAQQEKARATALDAVRKAQVESNKATVEGMERERKAVKKASTRARSRRDHFSK